MANSKVPGLAIGGLVVALALSGLAIAGERGEGCPAAKAAQAAKSDSPAARKWAAADANSDGALDRAELEAAMPALAANLDALDLDGDGKLTVGELHHPPVQAARPARASWQPGTIRL